MGGPSAALAIGVVEIASPSNWTSSSISASNAELRRFPSF
jgi:hypothetical protein